MAIQHILVVDDEPLIRKFLVETLQRMGFTVQDAADGARALHLMKAETFDLVFADIKMPKISGMDLLRKARDESPETIMVMMTAYATVENAVEAMKIGAFDYIIKPFSPDQIEMVTRRAAVILLGLLPLLFPAAGAAVLVTRTRRLPTGGCRPNRRRAGAVGRWSGMLPT